MTGWQRDFSRKCSAPRVGGDLPGVAQAVAVLERARDHVGHDLHLAVAVRREAPARRDYVVVEHAQRAEGDVFRVMIVVKREMPARPLCSRLRRALAAAKHE